MAVQCPKCGGNHTQAIRVVVQSGTSMSSGVVTGVGIGTGGVGVGLGTTTSISKTSLAAKFSQPDKPTIAPTVVLGLAALGSTPWLQAHGPDVGFRYASIGVWLIFLFILRRDFKQWKEYREYHKIWEPLYTKGFHCNECGFAFIPK
ncbi:hypothetical protein [Andreprevotia chitinilytica]|uniref:hypothetical protein n=1 Tax=Andreprevotia chitinilytica TaxID=396808 RepID=UPI0012EBA5ED|nr:hypothetical protein [Andreprevotia chitinilytica]